MVRSGFRLTGICFDTMSQGKELENIFLNGKAIAEGHIHVSVTENVARTEEASKTEDSAKSSVENT